MRDIIQRTAVCLIGLAVLVGCQAPVVTIVHILPAAVPLEVEVTQLQVGALAVHGGPDEDEMSAFMAERLRQRLAEAGNPSGPPGPEVQGTFDVQIADKESDRPIRRWDLVSKQIQTETVPSLVRMVDVKGVFAVPGSGEQPVPLAGIEVRRSYDSRNDPAVWGDLGLDRPDDPSGVPAADEVIRELLGECVDEFFEMIRPLEVRVDVALRPVGGRDAKAGMVAVEQGDYAEALACFLAEARRREDDAALLFDVAVAAEASGQLQTAMEYYGAAAEAAAGRDELALEGAQRVERVIKRLGASRQ